jgi:lysophospholipase L1-like esterase
MRRDAAEGTAATPHRRVRVLPFITLLACAALLLTSGCALWRIGQSAELARLSEPLQQTPARPALRLLIVGDSTAVGTGAASPADSLAGLIAKDHPSLLIENRARDGAKFADVLRQLADNSRFDIVLVQAGGNDIIRLTGLERLTADVEAVARRAADRADRVVLMPAGNVGNAPFFFAPWSWLMTERARALHRVVEAAASQTGATYVNLFQERADDPFVKDLSLNARDGLHPSSAGYRVWFQQLMTQAGLAGPLSAASRT